MQPGGMLPATTVVPLMRYRDVAAAIDWLCNAFGFERHFVVGGEGGTVHYAQLTSGSGMIMLGPVADSDFDKLFKQPDEIGGVETQSCYLVVDGIEAHCARAKAAGADIVLDIKEAAFGAGGYSCRDLEGHIWNFGSYDPWRGKRLPQVSLAAADRAQRPRRRGLGRDLAVLGLSIAALIVSFSLLRERLLPLVTPVEVARIAPPARQDRVQAQDQSVIANAEQEHQLNLQRLERATAQAEEQLTRVLAQKEQVLAEKTAAEHALKEAHQQKSATESGLEDIRRRLAASDTDRDRALKTAEDVRLQLELERDARERAMRLGQDARVELTQERESKATAERAAADLAQRLAEEARAREAAERATVELTQKLSETAQAKETLESNLRQTAEKLAMAEDAARRASASTPAQALANPSTGVQQPAATATAEASPAQSVPASSIVPSGRSARVGAWVREDLVSGPKRVRKRRIVVEPEPEPVKKKRVQTVRVVKPKPPSVKIELGIPTPGLSSGPK